MGLFEISNHLLKQNIEGLDFRYLQDPDEKITLYLWQTRTEHPTIEKYQISTSEHMLEWNKDHQVKYARIDEGFNPMGMKRASLMYMQANINNEILYYFENYLKSQKKDYHIEVEQILHTFEKSTGKHEKKD